MEFPVSLTRGHPVIHALWRLVGRIAGRVSPRLQKRLGRVYEMQFQRKWAREFSRPENREKVREYWRTHRALDQILELTGIDADSRVLDVGCGISTVLHYLPGHRIGVDPLADRYRELYDYPDDMEIVAAPGEELPFEDGSFDTVFCSNVIDHCTDPAAAVAEMRRVLAAGGWLVLTVELHEHRRGAREPGHPHSFNESRLMQLLDGFQPELTRRSPWYGLRGWCRGEPPTEHEELIVVAREAG
jgi:SAM-dependent methyltransferase